MQYVARPLALPRMCTSRRTENTADGLGDPIDRQMASTSVNACEQVNTLSGVMAVTADVHQAKGGCWLKMHKKHVFMSWRTGN